MLDYRIMTFVTLCETMNYRKAAERLNITQPGVTQHIQYLEQAYSCKLFSYKNRILRQTEEGRMLEQYARAVMHNEYRLKDKLTVPQQVSLRIGATKTIGNYTMADTIQRIGDDKRVSASVVIDNTKNLLSMLDCNDIDFAAVEGFFNKSHYDYRLIKMEPFLGVCSKAHPFAGRTVDLDSIFTEFLVIREVGSGTRAIFEQFLNSKSYSLSAFERSICLSGFELIRTSLILNNGITFAYKAFADYYDDLAVFEIKKLKMEREFNYVYLKESSASELIDMYL